jgi:signal transduction histidine kinase/DNA-binding response OmpR family regulator
MDLIPQTFIPDRLFAGDSQAESLLRAINWSQSRLGPVSQWPATLRTALRICLMSRHAMIIWWGDDLTFFYNDAYAPTLGIHHPAAMGQPGQQVWPEIWDVIGPMLRSVMTTGKATWSDDELLFLERNGYPEETYHSFSYSPIEADDGTVGGVFTAVTETTQRVLAERRAVLAHDLAGALVDAHTTLEVAQQAVAILAMHPLDVPASLLYHVEPDETTLTCLAASRVDVGTVERLDGSNPLIPWALSEVLATQEAQIVPWGDFPFGGESDWSPQQALVLPIAEPGRTTPTLLWVAGLSPRRTLDEEYRALFTLLQGHLVTALAAAHAYETERQRAEALAALDRAKTVFFSNVSHEFRTPLALLMGPLADSLQDQVEPLPPGHHARLSLAQRNGQRLLKLVNTLLDFSRIEAGRVQALYVPTDLAELTTDLASTFRSLVEQAGMQLIIDCPPLPEPVYVDRDMWEKIVLNLLSNAFKFTFEGHILVQLRREGHRVVVVVQDTGTGIPKEEVSRLFERFHRVEGARARTQEGSGIGLALVQELVQMHGGTITVTSTVGVGTTFRLTLPLGTAHLPAERLGQVATRGSTAVSAEAFVTEAERWLPTTQTIPPPVLPETALGPEDPLADREARLLLADDNADMRDYLTRLLGAQYHVQVVANGRQALAAIQAEPPDLVLSDVMMPELDGFGLVQALRADPRTASIPILLLSARAGEEAMVEGLASGADDYLIKPFSARELLARVAAHLARARLRQEVQRNAAEREAVFEAVTDGLAVYDSAGHIVQANAALRQQLARVYGTSFLPTLSERFQQVPPCDTLGRSLREEQWPQYRILQGEILTGSTAMEIEVRALDEEVLTLSVTGAPLRDITGTIRGAVVATRDVTEHRRQEQVVRDRARQLQTIFEAVADGIVIYDRAGSLVEWNAALATLFEFHLIPEYAGLPVTERPARLQVHDSQDQPIAPEQLPFMRAVAGEVLTGSHAEDLLITLPSQKKLQVSVSAAPLRDETGCSIGAVAVYHDVTERRSLEHQVQVALEALLALTTDLVGLTPTPTGDGIDPLRVLGDRLVALVQRVFRCDIVMMGLLDAQTRKMQPVAMVGLTAPAEAAWWHTLPQSPVTAYLPPDITERLDAGIPVEVDLGAVPQFAGADESLHHTLLAPLLLGTTVIGWIGIEHQLAPRPFTDGDHELLLAMGRLCALAMERDHLLREQVAASARETALADANQRMNEFLGIVSHELRTPLTSVLANVQMSERGLRGLVAQEADGQRTKLERYHQLLAQSDRQLSRLNRLIADLLDVSRITAGKLAMRMERCDIGTIVQEGVQALQASWPHRVIELELPKRMPIQIDADPDRIEQVVVNLVTNACKYSPPDQPVHVRVRREQTQVRISVQDHGPGLSPAQQTQLFERFARLADVAQQDGSGVGLGLGLYICKTIIERHGGTMEIQSQVGRGSTFSFTVPLASA